MAITTQELQQICSRMDRMRDLIRTNPQHAVALFEQHPELYGQIKEIVYLLRELQEDILEVHEKQTKFHP